MTRTVLAQQAYVDSGFDQLLEVLDRLADAHNALDQRVKALERDLDTERRLRLAMKGRG